MSQPRTVQNMELTLDASLPLLQHSHCPHVCSHVVGFRAPNFRTNNLMGEVLAGLQFE